MFIRYWFWYSGSPKEDGMTHTRTVFRMVFCGVVFLALGASSRAVAATSAPPSCQTAVLERGYLAGLIAGQSVVHHAWDRVRNCDDIEAIQTLILDFLERGAPSSSSTDPILCRYGGIVDGIFLGVEDVNANCAGICMLDDAFVGVSGGTAACALAGAVAAPTDLAGFINGPSSYCPVFYWPVCEEGFAAVTSSRCPLAVESGVTDSVRRRVCEEPLICPSCDL
jgi:hypothetical protein